MPAYRTLDRLAGLSDAPFGMRIGRQRRMNYDWSLLPAWIEARLISAHRLQERCPLQSVSLGLLCGSDRNDCCCADVAVGIAAKTEKDGASRGFDSRVDEDQQ